MGYLDNSTVTVDAVLTKKMRKNLANGKPIDIKYFCLSDTGVDYTLYNEDHPLGSSGYGEAITKMPNLEAHSNASYTLLNKLITLDRNTTFMPTVVGVQDLYDFGARIYTQQVEPKLHPAGTVPGENYMLVITDDSLVQLMGCTPVGSFDDKILSYLAISNVETVQACTGTKFGIKPKEVAEAHTLNAVFIELSLGVARSFQITMKANEETPLPLTVDTGSPLIGKDIR